jgi:hypothetical protein
MPSNAAASSSAAPSKDLNAQLPDGPRPGKKRRFNQDEDRSADDAGNANELDGVGGDASADGIKPEGSVADEKKSEVDLLREAAESAAATARSLEAALVAKGEERLKGGNANLNGN